MRTLWRMSFLVAVVLLAIAAPAAWAEAAKVSFEPGRIYFEAQVDYERAVLTVSMPGGEVARQEFDSRQALVFDLASDAPDGAYRYELRLNPRIDPALRKALVEARRSGDEAAMARLRAQLPEVPVMSGGFLVETGAIVMPEGKEPTMKSAADAMRNVTAADQVIPDDLIVQGSECVGLDCVNNENFGFDTIRLKENNLRIHFDDTSTTAGFPANDWTLIANDSASGGSSKFSIEDRTSAKVPFTITAGASTNSIFVDSTGRVGFRTSTPVLDLHVATSNTPAIRLEQNNSGGFTAQTWDIGANEANFFIRDVTGGSKLSLRIRPGAPTSSIDISADGDVGIGTASPADELTVKCDDTNDNCIVAQNSTVSSTTIFRVFETSTNDGLLSVFDTSGNENTRFSSIGNSWVDPSAGGLSINCKSGFTGAHLTIGSADNCSTAPNSTINAGASIFTTTSSRSLKEHLEPVQVDSVLDRIAKVPVYTYDFIKGPRDVMGLVAEDFHQVFGRGSDKLLNGQEVQMALWLAVQELTKENQTLAKRLEQLEVQLKAAAQQP